MVGSVVLLLERPSMHKADALASVLVAALVISAVCRVADQEQVDSGWGLTLLRKPRVWWWR